MYSTPTENIYPRSPVYPSPPSYQHSLSSPNYQSASSLSPNEVSRLVNAPLRDGEVVKGKSRIQYVPYEKKIT